METATQTTTGWLYACQIEDTIENAGVCLKLGGRQVALFNFARTKEWYATQNECPHKRQMILSRGMIGSLGEKPKVACPFHKKTFALDTGECLSGDECSIQTYPVKVEDGKVYIKINM